jgi:hypothetical protein
LVCMRKAQDPLKPMRDLYLITQPYWRLSRER